MSETSGCCSEDSALIVLTSDDIEWVGITLELLSTVTEGRACKTAEVLDLRDLDFMGFSHRRGRFFAKRQGLVDSRVKSLGLIVHASSSHATKKPIAPFQNIAVEEAVNGAMFGVFRDDKVSTHSWLRKYLARRFYSAASIAYESSERIFSQRHFCRIYVPNGRFPAQVAVILSAEARSIPLEFWEKGVKAENLYLGQCQPTDFQKMLELSLEKRISSEDLGRASKYLDMRVNLESGDNVFSRKFKSRTLGSDGNYISFFTSSQDEFWSLGKRWPIPKFHDQLGAFEIVAKRHLGPREVPVLRMHPNTLNKSVRYAFNEFLRVHNLIRKNPSWIVIWPSMDKNSYELIQESKGVIVWNSTIGTEALHLGKPVRFLAQGVFSIASERTLLELPFNEDMNIFELSLDPKKLAIEAVARLFSLERPLREENKIRVSWSILDSIFAAQSIAALLINVGYAVERRLNLFLELLFRASVSLTRYSRHKSPT